MLSNIVYGSQNGTGASIDINLGFIPDEVLVVNYASATIEELRWYKGMADASAIKTVTGTVARTKITSLGITPLGGAAADTIKGFRIGADTDVNVNGEALIWRACRNGPGSGR